MPRPPARTPAAGAAGTADRSEYAVASAKRPQPGSGERAAAAQGIEIDPPDDPDSGAPAAQRGGSAIDDHAREPDERADQQIAADAPIAPASRQQPRPPDQRVRPVPAHVGFEGDVGQPGERRDEQRPAERADHDEHFGAGARCGAPRAVVPPSAACRRSRPPAARPADPTCRPAGSAAPAPPRRRPARRTADRRAGSICTSVAARSVVHGATILKYTGRPATAAASIRSDTPDPSGAGPTHAARVSANTGATDEASTGANRAGSRRASANSRLQSIGRGAAGRVASDGPDHQRVQRAVRVDLEIAVARVQRLRRRGAHRLRRARRQHRRSLAKPRRHRRDQRPRAAAVPEQDQLRAQRPEMFPVLRPGSRPGCFHREILRARHEPVRGVSRRLVVVAEALPHLLRPRGEHFRRVAEGDVPANRCEAGDGQQRHDRGGERTRQASAADGRRSCSSAACGDDVRRRCFSGRQRGRERIAARQRRGERERRRRTPRRVELQATIDRPPRSADRSPRARSAAAAASARPAAADVRPRSPSDAPAIP